jgi:hypothetical protein
MHKGIEEKQHMKKFFLIFLMLLIAAASFAQNKPVDVRAGRTYIVKSTDGSGEVPLYGMNVSDVAFTVPDDTEFYIISLVGSSSRLQVQYEGQTYHLDKANVAEETAESIAKREEIRRRNRFSTFTSLLYWAMIIVAFIVLLRHNKKVALKIYGDYYTKKRREFPWLEEYWKRFKYEDAAQQRASASAGGVVIISIILFFGLAILIGFITDKILPSKGPVSYILSLVIIVAIFTICAKVAMAMIKSENPATSDNKGHGLVLECPSCKCPHAWGMLFQQNIVGEVETTRTTTETWEEDSSGRRVFGSTKTRTREDAVYKGRVIRDFKCENCGHTHHGVYGEAWGSMPVLTPQHFNPPRKAWESL